MLEMVVDHPLSCGPLIGGSSSVKHWTNHGCRRSSVRSQETYVGDCADWQESCKMPNAVFSPYSFVLQDGRKVVSVKLWVQRSAGKGGAKSHASVARRHFASQIRSKLTTPQRFLNFCRNCTPLWREDILQVNFVKKLGEADHFWKLWKKCTPPWREAHSGCQSCSVFWCRDVKR